MRPHAMNVVDAYFRGKRALITGGLGFIGSNLARRLVELGADVVLVDSLVPEYGGNLFNIDGIESRVRVNMQDPNTDLEINARAQLSILETCRKHNPGVKVVFASTRQIYGKPQYLPVDEKHLLIPVDVNGINKMAGEAYHVLYNNVYGIRACALRLTNTYGPRTRVKDARQTFLGIWTRLILEGKPFEVWDGSQLRDFTYVDDAVEAFLLAAASEEADGRVFNLGGADPPISLKDLADLLVGANGGGRYELRTFPSDRKRIDVGDYYADDRAIRSALSWQPRMRLREGLAQMLEYYRQHLPRYL